MIQFDEHIFQMGWNHQLDKIRRKLSSWVNFLKIGFVVEEMVPWLKHIEYLPSICYPNIVGGWSWDSQEIYIDIDIASTGKD